MVGAIAIHPEDSSVAVLVVSGNGYGKRSSADEYRITSRGAKGVKTINITDKTGPLVAIKSVTEENDLMIITKSGLTIRVDMSEVRLSGRATQGVRLINLREGDAIAAVSPVDKSDEEEATEAAAADTNNDNQQLN